MQGQTGEAVHLPRGPVLKAVIVGVILAVLATVAGMAALRETRSTSNVSAAPQFTGGLAMSAKSALTPEEETYAAALWPIHSEVKAAAIRMTFAGLDYKTEGEDAAKLRATVEPLTRTFQDAARRARQIVPPASLRTAHASYLEAIGHYGAASREMVKVNGNVGDAPLLKAHQRSEQASHALLELSDVLWPGEYKPN